MECSQPSKGSFVEENHAAYIICNIDILSLLEETHHSGQVSSLDSIVEGPQGRHAELGKGKKGCWLVDSHSRPCVLDHTSVYPSLKCFLFVLIHRVISSLYTTTIKITIS
jgi:hypothetical protein